jgi:outer membrane lipoprotein-sorting protein
MRKIISLSLLLFLGLSAVAQTADNAKDVVADLAQYITKLGRYEATFKLQVGDYVAEGRYMVEGNAYHIIVGSAAEVYCDGKVRYEVDKEREEVNIDVVDASSRNILDNPTRCFDFVGSDYRATVVAQDEKQITLKLVSTDEKVEGEIFLTVDAATYTPKEIEYCLYDERFNVKILSLAKSKSFLSKFDRSRYRNYEIIDFR